MKTRGEVLSLVDKGIAIFCLLLLVAVGCGKSTEPLAGKNQPVMMDPVPSEANHPRTDADPETDSIEQPEREADAESEPDGSNDESAAEEEASETAEESTENEEAALADDPEPEGSAEQQRTEASMNDEETMEEVVAEELPPAHRLFLPTTQGLLLVDLDVRIDGKSLAETYEQRVDAIVAEARGESDRLAWDDLLDLVQGDAERFGRNQSINKNQYKEIIRRYDQNRNRTAEGEEVAKFLFRNSGYAGPLRLVGTDYHRDLNRSESPIFHAIDSSDDGVIDDQELADAAVALLRLDQNADSRISLDEASIEQSENDPAWNRRRSNRRGEVAMDLEGYVDWTLVPYSIDASDANEPFGIDNQLIAKLDGDGDGTVSVTEAKTLRTIPADLRIRVDFSEVADQPSVELVSIPDGLEAAIAKTRRGDMVSVASGNLMFLATVRDARSGQNQVPREVFDMFDANADGFLEEDEIPDAAPDEFSVEALDKDDDDKLTFEEINSGRRGAQPFWSMQVRGRAAEFPDAVFAMLDRDHNLLLSEREIADAGLRLRRETMPVRPADLTDVFVLQIARGDPSQDNTTFRFEHRPGKTVVEMPRWATSMDANDDGELSRREFIGTAEQFERLDANQDGFLDAPEVNAEVAAEVNTASE